jgi:hypothetical protein
MTGNANATNVIDLDSRRDGFTLHHVRAALAGRFDAALLTDDEAVLFDDLFGASLDMPVTAEARAFKAGFAGQPNTDL